MSSDIAMLLPEPPAIGAIISSLTDAQVAHVLAQDYAQWADALPYILGTPASNRDLLRTRFAQGAAFGDVDTELARLHAAAALARHACPSTVSSLSSDF